MKEISYKDLNENNYKEYLESAGYISKDGIKMSDSTVSIQEKTYIYRYKYYCKERMVKSIL